MSHEKSITIKAKTGGYVNIKTVYKGRTVSNKKARDLFESGKTRRLGGKTFSSMKAADTAAKKRSDKFRPKGIR